MKIIDLLKKDAIALNVSLTDKEEAIDKLISLHEKAGNLADKAAYKEAILAREAQGSTAIGEGIAVPHAKSDSVKTPGLSAITVPNGVDYGAPDSKPSDILFMIAAPVDGDLHLEILSRLMVMLMEPEFCAALRGAKTTDEFLEIIDKRIIENINQAKCLNCGEVTVPIIVPPTYFKNMSNVFLSTVWNKSEMAIRDSDVIVFCGYSFPEADMHIKYLLKRVQTSRKKDNLKVIVVNNHSKKRRSIREKEKNRYKRFLGKDVIYTTYSFEEFAENPKKIIDLAK